MLIKDYKVKPSAILRIGYLVFLIITFFYVESVLDTDSFKATEKQPKKPAVKIEDVTVNLTVNSSDGIREYKAKLTNTNSVKDLLDELRDKQGFLYESDLYTYGTELVTVFNKEADSGKKWIVTADGKDVTTAISNTYLTDKATYELSQNSR